MAKSFTKLKNPALNLTDKLPFGKYKDCRICDILDDWEYLQWLSKNTSIMFSKPVLDEITARWKGWAEETHYREEVAPYIDDEPFEDVPF